MDDSFANNGGAVWALWGQGSEYGSQGGSFNSDASTVAGGSRWQWAGMLTGILPDMDGDGKDELFWWQRDSDREDDEIHVVSGADVSAGGALDAEIGTFFSDLCLVGQ